MFGLFKKIDDNDKEVTINPDVLFNSDIDTSEIKVHGLKLQDKAALIPFENVSTTTFEKPPTDVLRLADGSIRTGSENNKVYYETSDGFKEYPLIDRINSILSFGGIFHMKSGAKYVIRNGTIIGIGIHQDIVRPYKKIPKGKIEAKFGEASKVEEYYEQTDGELWNTYYFYENRNMVINFFEPDREINYVNIGLFPFSVNNLFDR